ncbi:MAG: VOC family protein [Mesorhizobium sp.]|nr:VOC family protein [Mesorhizobium sp.]
MTKDMNSSVEFFVNVLGLGVKGTTRRTMNEYPAGAEQRDKVDVERLYFLQAPDGAMLVLAEAPRVHTPGVEPCLPAYWPTHDDLTRGPGKVDHIAFNVETRADLVDFQNRLRAAGHQVSEINERMGDPKFVKSIYFHSPDGLPMEICTWDWTDPAWEAASMANYMRDPDPVPALQASHQIRADDTKYR